MHPLFFLYCLLASVAHGAALLAVPFIWITRWRRRRRFAPHFIQRLGYYRLEDGFFASHTKKRIWLHASSVGEVRAALILIDALYKEIVFAQYVLSVGTEQGLQLARSRLPDDSICLIAPLDTPWAVRRAITAIAPCLYICLETELWPLMLTSLHGRGIPLLLLNGRLSSHSLQSYARLGGFIPALLQFFARIAVISQEDMDRFIRLGVPPQRLTLCGNIKYDLPASEAEARRAALRRLLAASEEERIFLCGSTHADEEQQLLPITKKLAAELPLLWVIAPRHVERLASIEALLRDAGLRFQYYSELGRERRSARVVLVDTMGDLAELYCAADFIFCGGSLAPKGGHNLLEAARWARPVCFGPFMEDFADIAGLLIQAGGGFQVNTADELHALILRHHSFPTEYQQACAQAGRVAAAQRGAARRQALMVKHLLAHR